MDRTAPRGALIGIGAPGFSPFNSISRVGSLKPPQLQPGRQVRYAFATLFSRLTHTSMRAATPPSSMNWTVCGSGIAEVS